ncbi:alpha/beta fold hydrolase [Streptomyces antimycoticus]|uniref:Alpha/beta hydrolase n=4 Tax=Streptomyces violaceusniger group TaxID=2839105 RepID=A0ABD5J812_9ACTN|nr:MULTISPECIES: alpha/beta hydrolase [Streptomyces]KUL43273.1 alpha/beta hydrolase [Streptomyces violaceusniger]MEE4584510.1 alpha/beta hydrolase [Streptomyces sp. DSM 41602]WJE00961.1 alpha/beta hydrolase [Streptomyces antimycoticus]WTB10008.1 alpha/beta hydrolase [Streptomyces antimycoticus]
MTRTTHTLTLDQGTLDVTVDLHGRQGHPFLLLHGGGGPQTVAPFAGLLAEQRSAKVFSPVHPGFDGTARPDWLTDVTTLARVYAHLLDALDLRDVAVVGNSIGGWIAAELGTLNSDRISSVTLVNAVGIHVPGHPIADTFGLTPVELSRLSFHDPSKFRFDPSALSEARRAAMAANSATLQVYSGPHTMADPTLAERLAKVAHPTLVAWGASDQIVDADYGRAYAQAVPDAEFRLLPGTGHMPQSETPGQLLPVVWDFADAHAAGRPRP